MVELSQHQKEKIKEHSETLARLKTGMGHEKLRLMKYKEEYKDKVMNVKGIIKDYNNEIARQKKTISAYKKGK